MFTEAVMQWLL